MLDYAYHIGVFDSKDRSHGDRANLAQGVPLHRQGPSSAIIDAYADASIVNLASSTSNYRAGAAVR
jgi:hypothetical protein